MKIRLSLNGFLYSNIRAEIMENIGRNISGDIKIVMGTIYLFNVNINFKQKTLCYL